MILTEKFKSLKEDNFVNNPLITVYRFYPSNKNFGEMTNKRGMLWVE